MIKKITIKQHKILTPWNSVFYTELHIVQEKTGLEKTTLLLV